MTNEALVYIGSGIIILWGIAHLIPTKNIVKGFGDISSDNKKVLAMEIIAEGLTLIFLGLVPLLFTIMSDGGNVTVNRIIFACALMLLVMALLTLFSGARTPTIWYKICLAVKTAAAILFILGSIL
jgi:hypothetical protein